MANIKSQKKRIKTSELQRQRNVSQRSKMKTLEKRATAKISAGSVEDAAAEVKAAISAIDRACSKGVLHRNQAARRKAILQNSLNRMSDV
ncbi:MAG TPA: 30S ribosomal protein S20 [Candidatus Hydrogenedentes bacterium]|jgi:small subunit ribosomal protein S20|nr:30S ribosomal protein S20 [Candidatus Hydrogenedentota bacterium]